MAERHAAAPRGSGGALPARVARGVIFALDRLLRRALGIFEYSTHPDCMLRAAIVPAPADLVLTDGSRIERGRPIVDLHLWNEHVPSMAQGGPDLAWVTAFDRQLRLSLSELAAYLTRHPELSAVHAVRIETAFGRPDADMNRIGRRFGFEIVRDSRPRGALARLHRFAANFLFLALTWAYNPASLAGKRFRRHHDEYWMSRAALEARYGASRAPAA